MESLTAFFNSSFFVALTTAAVGMFAIGLYSKQKGDKKRDAASLILQEIRFAEQQIRTGVEHDAQFVLGNRLLPTNNWNVNIHLFLNDLEETEIDLISRFYSKAAYIETLISKISDYKNKEHSVTGIVINQNTPSSGAQNHIPILPVDPMANTQGLLKITCKGTEHVYNTPTGEKLKILAKKKFLFII